MTLGDDRILAALRQLPSERKGLFSSRNLRCKCFRSYRTSSAMCARRLNMALPAPEFGASCAWGRSVSPVLPSWARFHPMAVLRKDFPTLLTVLYELEMGEFKKFRPPAVFLHHQMTDLALSFDNRIIFETYARVMRRRFGTEPGLVTSNFERLGQKLIEWDIPISLIAAPLNKENFLMPGGMPAYQEPSRDGALPAHRHAPVAPLSHAPRDNPMGAGIAPCDSRGWGDLNRIADHNLLAPITLRP